MSDPPKPLSTFSFGTPATSGGAGNTFGQSFSNTSKPAINELFGSSSNPPATSSPLLSGSNTNTAPANSLFGANTQKPSRFGATQQVSSGGSIFSGGGSSSGFAGFSTPNKPAETSSAGQSSGFFSTAGSTGSGAFFGNAGSNAASGQTNATPASKQNTGFFFGSTTPAGNPPLNIPATGGTTAPLLGNNKPQEGNATNTSTLFRNLGAEKSSAQPSGGATTPNNSFSGFSQPSGSLSGSSRPLELNATTSSVQPSDTVLGAAQRSSSPNLFDNKASQPGGGMSSNLKNPQGSGNNSSQGDAVRPNLFPNLRGQSSGTQSTSSSTENAPKPAFTFPAPKSQPTVEDSSLTPTQATTGFGLFSQPTTSGASTIAPATALTTASASGLFSSLGVTSAGLSTTTPTGGFLSFGGASTAPSNTSTATTTAPSTTSATSASTSQHTSQAPTAGASSGTGPSNTKFGASTGSALGTGSSNANIGASTSGPPPTTQSRLKNKSMDEIITRWASDLSKYQKEFQKQAERVAAWDRMLVENSEKIQKLYGSTLEAERATTEVERQLTAVENDQNELEIWLDYYEKEVDSLTSKQIGQGESLHGPDSERERTYNLAERLSDRLDEMGKDLSSMIEEINDASSTLNKNSKADDPLSQVVRVLNSHLTQLQQIDQGAAALQLKVAAAQKAGQNLVTSNGFNGPISDAADGFYRSYMGRR